MSKFITFEGCDGCGKTTVLKLVSEELSKRNIDFLLTREPGGSKIAEQISYMQLVEDSILLMLSYQL